MEDHFTLHSIIAADAVTYFFVNSGVFIAVTGGIFFLLGLWFGRLLWGRYKRLLREAEEVIGTFKAEVSTLKRRLMEQPSRGVQTYAHAPPLALAPLLGLKGPFFPVSRMFYVWGEPGWELPRSVPQAQQAAGAFSLWTEPSFQPVPRALYTPSLATTVWTEPGWVSVARNVATSTRSRAFGLWTELEFHPVGGTLYLPSRAFTLSSESQLAPVVTSQPLHASRAHSLWTEPDFEPRKHILYPHSAASTLWLEETFSPQPIHAPLPPSRAFCVWTERSWSPPKPVNHHASAKTHGSDGAVTTGGSIFSRAFAAAKNLLKRGVPVPLEAPQAPIPAPVVAGPDVEASPVPASALPVVMPRHDVATVWQESTPSEAVARITVPPVPVLGALARETPPPAAAPVTAVPLPPAVPSVAAEMSLFTHTVSGAMWNETHLGVVYLEKPDAVDDLTKIKGVGDVIAHQLNRMGIFTFKQIGQWTDSQAREVSKRLAFKERVVRDRWVAQARQLHFKKHGEALE